MNPNIRLVLMLSIAMGANAACMVSENGFIAMFLTYSICGAVVFVSLICLTYGLLEDAE